MGRRILPILASLAVLFAASSATAAKDRLPQVVFDLPLTVECRDVTPKSYEEFYGKKVFEAVFKISPQLVSGEEKDLKQLHYEISTEQQMPIIGYLPNSQLTSDVDGSIAIKTSDRQGHLLVHYFFTPTAGDASLRGSLSSSQAQYTLLAPKQILVASGTIQRGCGVYFELRTSTQDTLQKQREYACLFEVPAAWRADYAKVTCTAKGLKRVFTTVTEVHCGVGMLSVGLYRQHDGEAREQADHLARTQQVYLDRLTAETRAKLDKGNKTAWLAAVMAAADQAAASRSAMKAGSTNEGLKAALASPVMEDKRVASELPLDRLTEADGLAKAKEALRRLNGRE